MGFHDGDDTWGNAVSLGALLGGELTVIPSVSPDGRFLFFAARNDLYWVGTEIFENVKPRK